MAEGSLSTSPWYTSLMCSGAMDVCWERCDLRVLRVCGVGEGGRETRSLEVREGEEDKVVRRGRELGRGHPPGQLLDQIYSPVPSPDDLDVPDA